MVQCPNCDREDEFKTIGNHWRQSCKYPELNYIDNEMMKGLLMGDACIRSNSKWNVTIEVISTNKEFLKYIDNRLGVKSTGFEIKQTPDEIMEEAISSDVISVNEDTVFRDKCRVTTRSLPCLNEFSDWYGENGKRFPEDLDLTSECLKFWYVCDGGLSWNKKSNSTRVQISSSNESDRLEEIAEMFDQYDIDPRVYSDRLMLNREDTGKFMDVVGDPIPGFEYKWEIDDLDRYEYLYQNAY